MTNGWSICMRMHSLGKFYSSTKWKCHFSVLSAYLDKRRAVFLHFISIDCTRNESDRIIFPRNLSIFLSLLFGPWNKCASVSPRGHQKKFHDGHSPCQCEKFFWKSMMVTNNKGPQFWTALRFRKSFNSTRRFASELNILGGSVDRSTHLCTLKYSYSSPNSLLFTILGMFYNSLGETPKVSLRANVKRSKIADQRTRIHATTWMRHA